jgi:hypothetical protein
MNTQRVLSTFAVVTLCVAAPCVASATPGTIGAYNVQDNATPTNVDVPGVNSISVQRSTLRCSGGATHEIAVGERCGDWELVAILPELAPIAVLERDSSHGSFLAYVGQKGPVATIRKPVGDLEDLRPRKRFAPDIAEHMLAAQRDVVGDEVRSSGQEPSFGALVELLPPLNTYTFLGTTTSQDKLIVWQDGRLGLGIHNHDLASVLFNPLEILNYPSGSTLLNKEGLLGGYLPAIDYGFLDPESHSGWEEMAVSVGQNELTTYVSLRTTQGRRSYWKLPGGHALTNGTEFYRQVLAVQKTWEQFFSKGMQLHIPEQRVADASKAAIVRALISEVGLHPKYGVGSYGEPEHDAFPPTTIQLNLCLLDWGFTQEVKERLGYYLSHYIKPDGSIDYYGPAVSEYGQLLTVAVRYVQLTGDRAWLAEHLPQLERLGNYLVSQITASRKRLSPRSEEYGLIRGAGEADTSSDQRFYFSGNVWCWRGLRDFGEMLEAEGRRTNSTRLIRVASEMRGGSSDMEQALTVSLQKSMEFDATPPFLSPVAGRLKPFERMTESEFASYTNYRYWIEMLSPSFLHPSMRKAIIAYRTAHGGELAGTTRFEDHLDDWTYADYAWGLLEDRDVDHYLLGFYGHLAYHQTLGTFTAYEQVAIKGESARSYVADYCVPAELVIPQMLRWMLVWEPWETNELWVSGAIPERWLQGGVAARHVITRWGPVSIEERQSPNGRDIQIERELAAAKVTVYIPVSAVGIQGPKIVVRGTKDWQWDSSRRAIKVQGPWRRLSVNITAQ